MNHYALRDDEFAYATNVGLKRLAHARAQNRHLVGHIEGDDFESSYVRGARFECAFYLWLGGKNVAIWNHYWSNPTVRQLAESPDIVCQGDSFDVKGRPLGWDDFIVRKQSLKSDRKYVLCCDCDSPRLVMFRGWITGDKIASKRLGGRREVPGYVIEWNDPDIQDCIRPSPILRPVPSQALITHIEFIRWGSSHLDGRSRRAYSATHIEFVCARLERVRETIKTKPVDLAQVQAIEAVLRVLQGASLSKDEQNVVRQRLAAVERVLRERLDDR